MGLAKRLIQASFLLFAIVPIVVSAGVQEVMCKDILARKMRGKNGWVPGNADAEVRHKGKAVVENRPVEMPMEVDAAVKFFRKHGIVAQPDENMHAAYNPAIFPSVDGNGVEWVNMFVRGEKEFPDEEVKRKSLLYWMRSKDGEHFEYGQKEPIMVPTLAVEAKGGIEDPRVVRLLVPVVVDGKSYNSVLYTTAYDGTTPRITYSYFNAENPTVFLKMGLLFDDTSVVKNPLVPGNPGWVKSAVMSQYVDPYTKKMMNVLFVGEGNESHGGIRILTADSPSGFKWPASGPPNLLAKDGHYTQNLIESAFPPRLVRLNKYLRKKLGKEFGLEFYLHGESPPNGYQVGFGIANPSNPTEIWYMSKGPFLTPVYPFEKIGQVDKVVFASGSLYFRGQLLVYYGGTDRYVGMASAPLSAEAAKDARLAWTEIKKAAALFFSTDDGKAVAEAAKAAAKSTAQ